MTIDVHAAREQLVDRVASIIYARSINRGELRLAAEEVVNLFPEEILEALLRMGWPEKELGSKLAVVATCSRTGCTAMATPGMPVCAFHFISPDRCVAIMKDGRCIGRASADSVLCPGHAKQEPG